MTGSLDTPHSPDDEKILQCAAGLFRQFGIRKPLPDTVTWDDRQDPDLILVKYGEIKLARSMMGTVTLEDWKLLLAPSIIYNYLLRPNQNRYSFTHLVLPLGLAEFPLIVALLQIFHLPTSANPRAFLIITVVLYVSFAAIMLFIYIKGLWRGLVYKADRQAAEALGRENLLAALRNHRSTASQIGFRPSILHLWPTLAMRIHHVERTMTSR